MVRNPLLVVEVLSRSTRTDRREKVLAYKRIPSLKEYLIVYQSKMMIELHRRDEDMNWCVVSLIPEPKVILECICNSPLEVTFDEIYQDVKWKENSTPTVRESSAESDCEELDW